MPLGTEVGLGSGHIVLDGEPSSPTGKGTAAPTFRPMSIMAKRLPISATVELLLTVCRYVLSLADPDRRHSPRHEGCWVWEGGRAPPRQ